MKNDNLYLLNLEGTQFCKIGVAEDVRKRVASIQTGNPINIVVVATYATPYAAELERAAHRYFADRRVRGEWFRVSPQEADEALQHLAVTVNVDVAMGDKKMRSRAKSAPFRMTGPNKPGAWPRDELYAAVRAAYAADPEFSRADMARRSGWSDAMVRKAIKEFTDAN